HTITYTFIDSNGCSGQDQMVIVVTDCSVGFKESNNPEIRLFPNPNQGDFSITGLAVGSTYEIIDELGKIILCGITNSSQEYIQMKDVSDGIYFIRSTKNDTEQVLKFTINKK
ncbi:MAG: T9SS type A sorting domain-containing protein, partial [Crocinitomicaceae bacterium]|nr:T9SS type A sorting domain-containing protein [Crocinitomicaceae bacterium]